MVGNSSGHKWKRRLGIGLALILVILWFLPTIIAHSPVLGWIVRESGKDLNGSVKVGGASLGWLSPIVLRDVSVRDAAGEPLMLIPKIESEKNLFNILLNTSNPGRFHCEKAALEVVFTKDATNLEKALANFFVTKAEVGSAPSNSVGALSPLVLALDFEGAKVTIHDPTSRQQWILEPVVIHLGLNQEGAPPLQIQVEAVVAGASPGTLQTEFTLDPRDDVGTKLKGRVENFPIALAVPVLRRYQVECLLEGRLRGQWDLSLGKNNGSFTGELAAQDCLAGGPFFGADTLRLAQIKMPWKLALEGKRLHVEKAEIVCDVGQASIHGKIDITGGTLTRREEPDINLALDVDLARLAEKLPNMLHLRKDTKLVAGRLTAACKSVAGPGNVVVWQGKVDTTELRGVRAGQNVSWPDPLALLFQVRQSRNELPTIELLRCESEFLKLDADGKGNQFTIMASLDLQRLAQPLGQFFDLSQMRLEGSAGGQITILRKESGAFQVAGGGFLRSFRYETSKGQAWHEDNLKVSLHGDGEILPTGGQRIESGYLRIESGSDILEAQIVEPIANLTQGPWGNLQVKLDGDLARWQDRLRPWTSALEPWQIRGTTQAQAKVRMSKNRLECTALTMTNRDFQCVGPGLAVREPTFELQAASGRVEIEKFKLELQNVLVRCPTLLLQAPSIQAIQNAGWVQLSPMEATLNGGKLRLDANLRLEPLELHLAKGLVLERAQITPAMCSGALGYALPALAGATEVQGLVSISLEGGHLDFTAMAKSDLKGILTLHSAKVGTGPMVREFNGLLRSPAPANITKESQVPFQVANGRVHHQNFALAFPDFTVRTSGSVGMDGTVAVMAEMPVPPKWLVNNPLAPTLARQTIRLPIGGTIDNPRLDSQALQAASAQFLRNAAGDALRQGLEGNLMKYLGR